MEAVNNKSLQTCVQSNTLEATNNCSSAINLSKRSLAWELNKNTDLIKFNAQVNYVDIISTHNNKFNAIAIATTSTQKLPNSDRTPLQITNNGSPNEHFMHNNDDICDNDKQHTPLENLNLKKTVNCESNNAISANAIESNEEAFLNVNNKQTTPPVTQNEQQNVNAEADDILKQSSVSNCGLNNNQTVHENVELPVEEKDAAEHVQLKKEKVEEAALQEQVGEATIQEHVGEAATQEQIAEASTQDRVDEAATVDQLEEAAAEDVQAAEEPSQKQEEKEEEATQKHVEEEATQEKIEMAIKEVENEIHENSLALSLPVDCTQITNEEHEHNQSVRSRCSSVSSTASSSSSNSSSTPHLIIDQPFAVESQQSQQPEIAANPEQSSRKRKSSNSSHTDTEEPPAKQAHLYCSNTDEHVCDDIQSPLKLKIKYTPKRTPEDEELSSYEYHEQKLTTLSSSVTSLLNIVRNNVYSRSSSCSIGANSTSKEGAPEAHQEISAVTSDVNVEQQDQIEVEFAVKESDEKHSIDVAAAVEEPPRIKPRLLKCVQCQTLHEYGHFFMHSYQKHQRYLCLYCKGSFRTAEKLSVHLEIKHDLEQNHFNTEEAMRQYVDDANTWEQNNKYIMCCTCQHVFVDHEPFSNHDCSVYMQPCSLCGQMGRHSNHCKAHPDASRRNKFSASLQQKSKPPNSASFSQTNYDAGVTDCDTETQTVRHHADEPSEEQQSFYSESNQLYNLNAQPIEAQAESASAAQEMEVQQQEENEAKEIENGALKLVVPKFKLRVPKEFQKSVDAVISSSEDTENEESATEDDAEEESVDEEQEKSETQQQQEQNETENDSSQNTIETSNESEIQVNVQEKEQNDDEKESPPSTEKDFNEALENISSQTQPDAERKTTTVHTNGPTEQWTHTPPASPNSSRAPEAAATTMLTDLRVLQQTDQTAEKGTTAEILLENQQNTMITPTTSSSSGPAEEHVCEDLDVNVMNDDDKEEHNINISDANIAENADEQKEPQSMETGESSVVDVQVADEDALPIELKLKQTLDSYNAMDFLRVCLDFSSLLCLYCNHARRIAVNAHSVVLHMLEEHRFTAVVESITEEQLQTNTLVEKLKSFLPEIEEKYINAETCNGLSLKEGQSAGIVNFNERFYECFMCRFNSSTYKELYLHNRKMHLRSAALCIMCRIHFSNFSEILCHMCPGKANKITQLDLKYRCCLCNMPNIPSTFRLMVHLRMKHYSCDVCLENCFDQIRLSLHVFKHKVRHLCYRCGIAYRNKTDIENHLFWKHSTEGIKCKRCLRKRWRHVYHFCTPPAKFPCDGCSMCFSKAMYLNVHARLHSGELKYKCAAENCEEKFVSRRLLEKHTSKVHPVPETSAENTETSELQEKTNITENEEEMEDKPKLEDMVETDALKPIDETKQEEKKNEEETTPEKVTESTEEKPEATPQDETEVKLEDNITTADNTATDVATTTPIGTKCKKGKRKKNNFNYLNLQAPNLSESSDSSSSDSDSSDDDSLIKIPKPMVEKSEKMNIETTVETSEKIEETKSSEGDISKVLEIWKNFLEDRDGNAHVDEIKEQKAEEPSIAEKSEESTPGPVHVAVGDHDYCLLMSPPNSHKKAKKHKKSASSSPVKVKQKYSTQNDTEENDAEEQSSSDSSSDDDESCCSDANCSCSDNSKNSNDSDSDSSVASNESISQHKKNNTKESCKSPHKKHNKQQEANNSSIENKQDVVEANTTEEIETSAAENREPEFLESDLATSESDSNEEFYDEHPQKESNLLQKRLQILAQGNLADPTIQNNGLYVNGEQQTASPMQEVNTNKKKFKKKREKRNMNNSNMLLHSFDEQPQQAQLYQETVVGHNYMQADPNLFYNNFSSTPQSIQDSLQYPYSADQTMMTAGAAFSEGGGSSSEPDGPLKRSKRKRRPNKFYGYTSDDESMNMSHGQRMMIGMRAFKPTPPPQLTWHKDDLPTPSKSVLNSSKSKVARNNIKVARNNLENAFSEFSELIGQDSRARTFGIAAGGKVGSGGAFYKRAAKRTNVKSRKVSSTEEESHQLPPIPRLKIKPTQLVLNLPNILENNTTDIESMQNTSTENLEHELDEGSSTSSTSSSEDEKELNKNSSRPRPRPSQPPLTSTQSSIVLPSAILAPPVPKTTAFNHSIPPALLPNPDFATLQYFKVNNIRYPIRPPAGARQAREGESVYCYCRCPYDEVSEMIACDGENCVIEWFHFECVGIMMAPQGKWYCAECRPKYVTELYAPR